MAETLRYGNENLASLGDNTAGLITPETARDWLVSNRSGGVQIIDRSTFTIPITNGVPVSINPLLPAPEFGGTLWTMDGNGRAKPNYGVAIPSLVIPPGFKKFATIQITMSADKSGGGEDDYLFQLDLDGTPVGVGLTLTLTGAPQTFTIQGNHPVDLSDPNTLIGITVTGLGTGDDIELSAFEMLVLDYQIWSEPT